MLAVSSECQTWFSAGDGEEETLGKNMVAMVEGTMSCLPGWRIINTYCSTVNGL